MRKFTSSATKSLGGLTPSRYYSGDTPHASKTIIEFYPQGALEHITKANMQLDGWNDNNSFSEFNGRTKDAKYLDKEKTWIGLDVPKGETGLQAMRKLLKVGVLKPAVRLAAEFGSSIANLSLPQKKRRKKWINDEDGDFIPEAYLSHDPQMFYAKRLVDGKKHRTNLVILAGGNCNITEQTISFRAQIYAQVIDELQRQGHNVGVHCMDPIGSHRHDTMHYILWEVKRHQDQLSIPALQRDLGHSAIYRTAIFDLIAAAPKNPGSGLGYTAVEQFKGKVDKDDKVLNNLIKTIKLELGEPTVILNLLPLDENIKENKMLDIISDIKTQLTNLITQPKTSGLHIINSKPKDE
tara:strand:+ start:2909 stop:3964 length:1056 start_codon:yes stop_codon:yes gene_type:complete